MSDELEWTITKVKVHREADGSITETREVIAPDQRVWRNGPIPTDRRVMIRQWIGTNEIEWSEISADPL